MIGTVPIIQPLPRSRSIDSRFEDPLFSSLPGDLKDKLSSFSGPYYHAVGDYNSYFKSVYKMDIPPVKEYLHNPYWKVADDYFWQIWGDHMKAHTRMANPDEILSGLNLATSPGIPLTSLGFHKKRDVLNSPWGREYLYKSRVFEPVWRVVAKEEWYHQDDLKNGKIRTFIIPPFKFLVLQKLYFQAQNECLIGHHWSAYGFNPYYGGTERLAIKLIGKGRKIFIMYDVVGWDRLLNFLREIYSLRVSCHAPADRKEALWVAGKSCKCTLLLADGTVIEKNDGNNSGSNNTTSDNILAHEKLLAYFLINLYDGDIEQLQHVMSSLFGDDNVFSIPAADHDHEDIKELLISVFSEFGYGLDPIVVSSKLEDMEFLGFKFGFKYGHWLPLYKVERIMASFCFVYEKNIPIKAQISKAFTLMIMLWPHGGSVYKTACDAYGRYLGKLKTCTDPTVTAYLALGVPTFDDCMSFYTGAELGSDPITPLFMFNLEVGGFKNE